MPVELEVGDRVLITGKHHPWRGHTGVVTQKLQQMMSFLPPMVTIRLDKDLQCMAKPEDVTLSPDQAEERS